MVAGASCSAAYGSSFDASSMICAGGTRGQDSCSGDSGGPLADRSADATVPASSALAVRLPDDHVWSAPRTLTIRLTATAELGLATTTLSTLLVDDDKPKLRLDKARRSSARKVVTTLRAPGAGTLTLRLVRGGRTLARRTAKITGTRSTRMTAASSAAELRRDAVTVRASWRSVATPTATATAKRRVR